MKFFIGILIGASIGVFSIALASTAGYSDAYMDGANAFKDFVIRRLTEMKEHTENVTCEQLMEELK